MNKFWAGICIVSLCLWYIASSAAWADPLKSTNYVFEETALGGLGINGSASTNYQTANSSGGILGFGNSASSSFQINAGNTTTKDPALEFGIDNSNVSFGSFSSSLPTVSTSSFQVSNYTSYGYVVQILGNPPSNGTHQIAAMSSTGPSTTGAEQFGINLVANTLPVSLGANPNHGQFGYGSATSNYGTANDYRYVSGESIASAPKSSGTTLYTISYIINVGSLTPGGQYSGSQTIICTGTY